MSETPASFRITIAATGQSYGCGPDTSVLQAGLAAGLPLPYSCRSGLCRTCKGQILQGRVDHGGAHVKYLSEAEREQGFALLCCARPLSDLSLRVQDAGQQAAPRRLPVRLLDIQRPAPDVALLTLGLPPNEPLHFKAGQFVDVLLPDGARRSYSIATAPRAEGVRQIELHVRHLPGGRFTDHLFHAAKARDMMRIEAPLGSFFLREDAPEPIVMLASGTGFAPIKSMLLHMIERGLRRPAEVYWGGRRRADLYQLDAMHELARRHGHIRFHPVLSEPAADDGWSGRTGLVHRAVMADWPSLAGHQVYACGAPAMVEAARRDFHAIGGLPPERFHADAFLSEADRQAATAMPA